MDRSSDLSGLNQRDTGSPRRSLDSSRSSRAPPTLPTPTPAGESTVPSRDIPAQGTASDLAGEGRIGQVSAATNEFAGPDLSGAIINPDWQLDSLVSHDRHSYLYTVRQRPLTPPSGVDYAEVEYHARVFTFAGVPGKVANSRRRNLKRLINKAEIHHQCDQDANTILIYKPTLQSEPRAHGQPDEEDLPESSRDAQRRESKRIKQQQRRQRQRESKNNPPANETDPEETAMAQGPGNVPPPGNGPPRGHVQSLARRQTEQSSLKFIRDLYNYDNSHLDSYVAELLTEKEWNTVVHRSTTLWGWRNTDIRSQHFKDYNEMNNIAQDWKEEILDFRSHLENIHPLWLKNTATEIRNIEDKLSVRMVGIWLKYCSRLLPVLINAAESRWTKLKKRAGACTLAHREYVSRKEASCRVEIENNLKEINDKVRELDPERTQASQQIRSEQKQSEGWKEYVHVWTREKEALSQYLRLLLPDRSEGADSEDDRFD